MAPIERRIGAASLLGARLRPNPRQEPLEHDSQHQRSLVVTTVPGACAAARAPEPRTVEADNNVPKKVRLVRYFYPDMFLAQRRAACDALADIDGLVTELNSKAAEGRSRRNAHSLAGLVTETGQENC